MKIQSRKPAPQRADQRPAALPQSGGSAASPIEDIALERVCGGYIGETEKNRPQ
jgi:hypothetical protein